MRVYLIVTLILWLISAGGEAQKEKPNWGTFFVYLGLGIWGAILLGY